jgi:hypothetical protein
MRKVDQETKMPITKAETTTQVHINDGLILDRFVSSALPT